MDSVEEHLLEGEGKKEMEEEDGSYGAESDLKNIVAVISKIWHDLNDSKTFHTSDLAQASAKKASTECHWDCLVFGNFADPLFGVLEWGRNDGLRVSDQNSGEGINVVLGLDGIHEPCDSYNL